MRIVMQQQLNPEFFDAQLKFLHSIKKEVCYSGAFRAGKSRALCYRLVKDVIKNPNNTVLMVRKTCAHLKKTTLNALINGDDAPPVLPLGSYKHNKVDQSIQINGGGRIFYAGMNDPMAIRSMSLGSVGIDEAIELSLEEYLELMGRLSLNCGTRQVYLATNPGVPGHWIYKRFFQAKSVNREVILARTVDNPFIPADYIESLKDYPETLYRRYALGEWTAMEGVIFDNFDRNLHMKRISLDEKYWNEYYIGVDIGYTDPSALLLIGKCGNRLTVIKEVYKTKMLQDTIVDNIAKMYEWCNNNCQIIVDPSQAGLIATLQSIGFNCKKANNDIVSGIALIRQALNVRHDKPDLEINEDCESLIKEMEMYCYKEGTEIPMDKHNHSVDALRYVCNEILEDQTTYVKPVLIGADDDDAVPERVF